MATKKKTTTKKTTTKKTTTKNHATENPATETRRNTPAPQPTNPDPLQRRSRPAPAPRPKLVPEPMKAATTVENYLHMGERMYAFQMHHPDGVVMELHTIERAEAESVLSSLDNKTPIMVCTPQRLAGGFTAIDLENLGFRVFYNGKFGKLVGIRGA